MYIFKRQFFIVLTLLPFLTFSQTIVDTELNLKQIDSSFHLFLNLSGNYAKGNVNMFLFNSNLTLGSRSKKNLYRLTFSNGLTKFSKTIYSENLNSQFRFNHYTNAKSSIFAFTQLGKSLEAKIDLRFLVGVGYRFPIYTRNNNYIDLAFGPFYELEKYPLYEFNNEIYDSNTVETVRLSFNLFSNINITDNLSLMSTVYTQRQRDQIKDYRVYLNEYLTIKISDKISFLCQYMLRFRSVQYVESIENDSSLSFGISLNL